MTLFARHLLAPTLAAVISLAGFGMASAQEPEWRHGSSLIGEPKYPAGFAHYDYVNPDAPKGGVLSQVAVGTFDSFNPFIVRGTPAAGMAAFGGGYFYDTLMDQATDQAGTTYGMIAEAMRYPPDFSSVTFRLDPAARWHDGQPITVDDVIWSFEILTEVNPLYSQYYHNVTGVEATGEREVTFTFDQTGNRELPNIMGDLTVLPKHWWEGTDASGKKRDIRSSTLEAPLGSGPYRIKSFQTGRNVVWERVPDYWAASHPLRVGRYNYDELRFEYFRDANAIWEAFKKGGIYDYRVENRAQRWAEGYDFPAFQQGLVKKATYTSTSGEAMQAYVLNTRREKFKDRRVRQALTLAFDFEQMNRTLFYGFYSRTDSYFDGTELASSGLPQGKELEILETVRGKVPDEVFTTPFTLPVYDKPGDERTHLRQASQLLREAGWEPRGGGLVNASTGETFSIEFLGDDPTDERVFAPYVNSLKRLGIATRIRIVDGPQYKALTDEFDYDVITSVLAQSQSPGNEQREFWGSAAADQPGSRNVAGIKDPAIDALVDKVIFAPDRETLVAATHALDRVLLWNFFMVPQWHLPEIWVAYWDKFGFPEKQPEYAGIDIFSWWIDADKAKRLEAAR